VPDAIKETAAHWVVEVGANAGEWSTHVQRNSPECEIYAFEIVPDTSKELSKI